MTKIVRRPDRAEGGITAAEREAMQKIVKKWIDIAFRTDPIEPDKIIPAIHALYAVAGLKKPRVVIVPSPLVMAIAHDASAAIWRARVSNWTAAPSDTEAATDAATYAATYAATDAATYDATRAATYDATVATDDATRAATDDATRAAYDATEANWQKSYQGGNMWAGWCSYIEAMRDVIGLKLPEFAAFRPWEDCAIHGSFRAMHREFCIVSDFPEILKIDDRNRPHCEDGPSHRWRDGWELYHWHGVRIPEEWIRDKTVTPEIALTWENVEQRRAACEIVGWDNLLSAMQGRLIERDPEPTIGELWEVDHSAVGGRARFLRMYCPTGRWFCEPVPLTVNTALEANAWGWQLPPELYKPSSQS